MTKGLQKTFKRLQAYSDRWWYVPLMALLVFLDLFVIVIPSEGLLIKTVLLRPTRWWYVPAVLVTASALGAALLGHFTSLYGIDFLNWLNPHLLTNPHWQKTQDFIDRRGAVAMALIAFSPFPQQPAVAMCGLGHMNFFTLFAAVWLGRAPKYYLFAWIAKQSPRLFARFFKDAYQEVQELDAP